MKTIFFFLSGLATLTLWGCQEAPRPEKHVVNSKDTLYLNAADSTLVSTMSLTEQQRLIKVYKLAEYVDLNLKDSVYTLTISKEEANRLGIDEQNYQEAVTALKQVNEAIEEYNHHHGPEDTIELADFKDMVK